MSAKKNTLSFDDARKEIKKFLPEFLKEQGIKLSGKDNSYMCKCFHPEHHDSAPSVHIWEGEKDGWIYYCHGCHRTGDIFVANNILNGTPLIGYEFISENMKPLADEYGIDFEMRPLTPEEIEEMNIKAVYGMIRNIIVYNLRYGQVDEKVLEYMRDKKLDPKTDSVEYALGYVPSWEKLVAELEGQNIPREYLDKIDIKQYIFNPHNLIFVINDENGITRGFAARNCYFNKQDNIGAKYYNTNNNAVFSKRSLLYNLNRALRRKVGKFSSLYIAEGQTDAIALDRIGVKACAIGGTKFGNDHISLLQKVGETDIVLLLDGDNAGIENTARAVTEVMEGIRNFRVRIVTLPDGEDPDSFIRKHGKDALLQLPHITAFEWRLFHLQEQTDLDVYELAAQVIPLIVNETSELQRDRMCKQVADACGIPIATVRKEVAIITDNDKIKLATERDAIIDNVVKSLKKNPTDAQLILDDGLKSVRDISEKHNANIFDESEFITELQNIKLKQENVDDEDCLNLWRMPRFEDKMRGSTAGKLFLLGGQPNAGKTIFMVNFCISVLRAQEQARHWGQRADDDRMNNVTIFYHTVDDARYEILPRFISALAAEMHPEVTINTMDAPYRYNVTDREGLLKARNEAYDKLTQWAKDGRLIIKDASIGNTLSTGEAVIRNLKQKYPDRHIIYIIDNLYNLADFPNYEDDNKRIKEISRVLKQGILVPHKIMGFATVEYRKGNTEGGVKKGQALNEMIKESKSLEYHASWIGHLLNELHTDPDKTEMFTWDPAIPIDKRNADNRSPIITLAIGKNKVTSFKGELHYYLLQNRALYLEIGKNDVANMTDTLKAKLGRYYFGQGESPIASGGVTAAEAAVGLGEEHELPNVA